MTFTIIMLICTAIVIVVAALFGFAVSKGYDYKHTVDPHPDDVEHKHDKKADT